MCAGFSCLVAGMFSFQSLSDMKRALCSNRAFVPGAAGGFQSPARDAWAMQTLCLSQGEVQTLESKWV